MTSSTTLSKLTICLLVLFQILSVGGEPKQDTCETAGGPRPLNSVASPDTTVGATIDDVNGGACHGVEFERPGIWWWVNGTGEVIRASSCDERTQIPTKISIFTGSCGALRCVPVTYRPDYECEHLNRDSDGVWGTIASAVDFPTFKGQHYFVLVQQATEEAGTVWMKYRQPELPQNNNCVDSVGPLPRDQTLVLGTTEDASVTIPDAGVCQALDLYPGVWYQVIGTGKPITLKACSEFNFDGFYYSVYNGATCNDLTCVEGEYGIDVKDDDRCTFGPAAVKRPMTTFTFDTKDRDRYYFMIHYARTISEKPTSNFRLFVDDGEEGYAGSGGITAIEFQPPPDGALADLNNNGIPDVEENANSAASSMSYSVAYIAGITISSSMLVFML